MQLALYGNRESGHSYKAALALALLDLAYDYHAIDLMVPRADRAPDFRAVARFGEVPVLVADGVPVVQSDAILMFLGRTTGELLGDHGADRTNEWLFWEANRIGFSVPNLRFARSFSRDVDPAIVGWLEARAVSDLDALDREFSGGPPFLGGDGVSIADIACCAYLFWPEQAGLDLARWPQVSAWLDRIRAVPRWRAPYSLLT